MGMSAEMQRKIKAALFIVMLASADVRVQQGAGFEMELMRNEPSVVLEQAPRVAKQMDAMLADPGILHQARRLVEQMEAMVALPSFQEQVQGFAQRMQASPEMNFQEQSDLFAQSMAALQVDPNFRVQSKRITARVQGILADPDFQQEGKRAAGQMEAAMADASLQESADSVVDRMFDKILARPLETSPVDNADLDSAMLGKSSSLAIQPRAGVRSSVMASSFRAASPASAGLSQREAVRTSALFGGLKKAGKEVPKKSKFGSSKKQPVPKKASSEPEEEFLEIPDEVQEFAREAAFLFMRLSAASVMLHHGQEKFLSAELFTKFAIDKYFTFLPEPHIFWTYSAGTVQFFAPFFLAAGVFSRAASAGLAGTMLGAFYYSAVSTGLEGFPLSKMAAKVPIFHNYGFETPTLYLAIFALVAASGPGKFSVAQALGWNDDNTILGKIKQ
jgi:uncharacterized membrane protein YphA (DoxX/SURF4 family)